MKQVIKYLETKFVNEGMQDAALWHYLKLIQQHPDQEESGLIVLLEYLLQSNRNLKDAAYQMALTSIQPIIKFVNYD